MTQGFQLDQNNVFEGFEDVQDGTYEVIIEHVREDANANTGTEFANVTMVIRNDIQQPHQNSKVWHRIWKAKADGKYNMIMFNTIGKAARLENGKTYMNFEQLLDDYAGKPIKITVKNETSEYNGKTYDNLNVKKWEQTDFPNVQHQFKNNEQSGNTGNTGGNMQQGAVIDINDDNLPF